MKKKRPIIYATCNNCKSNEVTLRARLSWFKILVTLTCDNCGLTCELND